MTDDHAPTRDQAEEEILTDTVSDEALEAAAGMERRAKHSLTLPTCHPTAPAPEMMVH